MAKLFWLKDVKAQKIPYLSSQTNKEYKFNLIMNYNNIYALFLSNACITSSFMYCFNLLYKNSTSFIFISFHFYTAKVYIISEIIKLF